MKLNKIKKGEILSTTLYMTVVDKNVNGIEVVDTNGQKFMIKGKHLIEKTVNSGSQFDMETHVTRTQLANILINAGDSVFTAEYVKQDGTPRVLTGKLIDTENSMGRSNCIDLTIANGNNLRQIDHRTLNSLILKNNKYIVKTK